VRRVAILGAGVMGASLAIFLARRGCAVTVFDREDAPVACASRWTEGKIHLGYLYGADPTLATARRLIPGGLAFVRLMSDLIGSDVAPRLTAGDDLYLVHRDSVVDADTLAARFRAVDALVREHTDAARTAPLASARRLAPQALATLAGPAIVAGFSVPERSVDTRWVADRLGAALAAEPGVSLRLGVEVTAAAPVGGIDGSWRVVGAPDTDERFDLVVNALWDGLLAIDASAALPPEAEWSYRYRRALFVRTSRALDLPCAVVAVGPFGDVKNYDGRSFYLSWYPAGLAAEGTGIALAPPPAPSAEDERRLIAATRAGLAPLMPWTAEVFEAAEEVRVGGGYVFAKGRGALSDPRSSLHRRDRFGLRRLGNYLSIDTGKYSTAPLLALTLADEICGT
jgi:glycine/D-amino acid oxidase-like deaminating enzyme